MIAITKTVTEQALALPCDERLALVDSLLASLNAPSQAEIDRLWAAEAERRVAEVDSGKVVPIDGESVFRAIRRRLER